MSTKEMDGTFIGYPTKLRPLPQSPCQRGNPEANVLLRRGASLRGSLPLDFRPVDGRVFQRT